MTGAVEPMPASFVEAVRNQRYRQAATDPLLENRWRQAKDPFARALLILSAAHLHIERGNEVGARAKFERAVPYLREWEDEAFAAALIAHAEDALRRLEEGTEVPPLSEVIAEPR